MHGNGLDLGFAPSIFPWSVGREAAQPATFCGITIRRSRDLRDRLRSRRSLFRSPPAPGSGGSCGQREGSSHRGRRRSEAIFMVMQPLGRTRPRRGVRPGPAFDADFRDETTFQVRQIFRSSANVGPHDLATLGLGGDQQRVLRVGARQVDCVVCIRAREALSALGDHHRNALRGANHRGEALRMGPCGIERRRPPRGGKERVDENHLRSIVERSWPQELGDAPAGGRRRPTIDLTARTPYREARERINTKPAASMGERWGGSMATCSRRPARPRGPSPSLWYSAGPAFSSLAGQEQP